jgi:hypothetical protein
VSMVEKNVGTRDTLIKSYPFFYSFSVFMKSRFVNKNLIGNGVIWKMHVHYEEDWEKGSAPYANKDR